MNKSYIEAKVRNQVAHMSLSDLVNCCVKRNISTTNKPASFIITDLISVMTREAILECHKDEVENIKDKIRELVDDMALETLVNLCVKNRIHVDTNYTQDMRNNLYKILLDEELKKLEID